MSRHERSAYHDEKIGEIAMIKIIKEGTRKTTECDHCGCVFSYDREDVEHELLAGGEKDYLICPQCAHEVVLVQSR